MFGVLERARARQRIRRDVGLWYHPEYASDVLAETARVADLEPRRGELILGKLMESRFIRADQVRQPTSASLHALTRFHPLGYVEQTLSAEALAHVFGLEPHFITDPDSLLTSARRQVGATVEAACAASRNPGFIAVNLGGGFHHAEPEMGSGFCVYNDIGVAVAALREAGYRRPIAIVDLDYHQGNGNSVAFADDPTVLVYSLHGSVWTHLGHSEHEIHLTGTVNDRRYLSALRTTLPSALRRHHPGLVFFIAGNDVLAGDRLGDFWLSLGGVLERDAFVIDLVRELGMAMVVTLGGGYSKNAWLASYHMVRYLLTGARRVEPERGGSVRSRFTQIARTLDSQDLTAEDDTFDITEADILGDLAGHTPARKLLDFYTHHGVELVFERYGLLDQVRNRGFVDLRLASDFSDSSHQILRMYGRRPPHRTEHLLLEIVARRMWIKSPVPALERMEVLFVDWLLLQDPTRGFTLDRPALPGQKHPGLGIAVQMQELLLQAARRLKLHGVFDQPSNFHNLLGGTSDAHFLDPEDEGRARAMLTVLAGIPSWEASRIVAEQGLRLADGEVVQWKPAMHAVPASEALSGYFESEGYRRASTAAMSTWLERGLHAPGVEASEVTV